MKRNTERGVNNNNKQPIQHSISNTLPLILRFLREKRNGKRYQRKYTWREQRDKSAKQTKKENTQQTLSAGIFITAIIHRVIQINTIDFYSRRRFNTAFKIY